MLSPGSQGTWVTKRLARNLSKGDRVFFWASTPALRIVGLGTISNPRESKDRDGYTYYRVRYLTKLINGTPDISKLRRIPILHTASFLKAGPATCIFPISEPQGRLLFNILVGVSSEVAQIWPDLIAPHPLNEILPPPDIDFSASEGTPRLVQHLRRERNPTLVKKKKSSVLNSKGRLQCECCGFDFATFYGALGDKFCEVHHKKPLANGNGHTRLADLAIVCSNCHRVIHRSAPMLTIAGLAGLLKRRNDKR